VAGQQLDVLTPRQSSNDPLDDLRVRSCLRKGPHVEQVRPRQPAHLRELGPQVRRQPLDHLADPAVAGLTAQDIAAEPPVEPDQLGVDRQRRLQPGLADLALQISQLVAVAGREIPLHAGH